MCAMASGSNDDPAINFLIGIRSLPVAKARRWLGSSSLQHTIFLDDAPSGVNINPWEGGWLGLDRYAIFSSRHAHEAANWPGPLPGQSRSLAAKTCAVVYFGSYL